MKSYKTPQEYFDSLILWREEVLLLRKITVDAGLEETIKWGGPCYIWGKENVVGLAAFKSYAGIWFYQGALLKDEKNLLINANEKNTKALRQMRFSNVEEISCAPISEYIYESIENFKLGSKIKPNLQKPLIIPQMLTDVLKNREDLNEKWNNLSLSCKREYAEYIEEAKREETKLSRIEKIIPMILSTKGLNDKYKR